MSPRHVAALLLALAPASFGCRMTWVDLTPDVSDVEEADAEADDDEDSSTPAAG